VVEELHPADGADGRLDALDPHVGLRREVGTDDVVGGVRPVVRVISKRREVDNTAALRALGRDPLVIKATRVDTAYGLVNLMTRAYDAVPSLCDRSKGVPRCLILYGGREDILNKGAVAMTLDRLPMLPSDQLRLAVYRSGHHLLLRDLNSHATFDDIASWLADPSQPLPSGADLPPSEIFRRNMYVCMIEEPVGITYRYDIGVDKILWECDYPHADTPWPYTQKQADEVLADLPAPEIDAVTHRNAEHVFNWKVADPALATLDAPSRV
jgi:hypothetical protein